MPAPRHSHTCGECDHFDREEPGLPAGHGRCYGGPPTPVLIPIAKTGTADSKILTQMPQRQAAITFDITPHSSVHPESRRACGAFIPIGDADGG